MTPAEAAESLVRSYTRGVGFNDFGEPDSDDIEAVVDAVAARLTANPYGLRSQSVDDAVSTTYTVVGELTWLEKLVLDRYRVRTA
jgi:hypothetical protein